MVTVDPGPRARAVDVAEFLPTAGIACNLEQLHLVPEESRAYLTCGDDDAHAFAGRVPDAIGRAAVIVLDRADALILTRTETVDDALAGLGTCCQTAIVTLGPRGTVAMHAGERVDAPSLRHRSDRRHDRRPRPALRRLRVGGPQRRRAARLHRLGAALRGPGDERADRDRRRRGRAATARGGRHARARAAAASAAPMTGASARRPAGMTGSSRASGS